MTNVLRRLPSNHCQNVLPKTSASLLEPSGDGSNEFDRLIDEASNLFPSFIGRSAMVGRVTKVEPQFKGFRVWFSQSFSRALSLVPGSLVSVSLPAIESRCFGTFPLISLRDECSKVFGIECFEGSSNEVGNYFALASAFPSCEVMDKDVWLSQQLSYTLGSPSLGKSLFIYSISNQSSRGPANCPKDGFTRKSHIHLQCKSKEVHLEFAPSRKQVRVNKGIVSAMDSSANSFDIKAALESGCGKDLLQACAVTWLCSCHLLCGNLVAISMLSWFYIFRVIGPESSSTSASMIMEMPCSSSSSCNCKEGCSRRACAANSLSLVHAIDYFSVGRGTKVILSLALSHHGDQRPAKHILDRDLPKLCGVSEEYAFLMERINSVCLNNNFPCCYAPSKGVLLHGRSGTGKMSLVQSCARAAGVPLFILGVDDGVTKQSFDEAFASAKQAAPSVLLVNSMDVIASRSKGGGKGRRSKFVALMLESFGGIDLRDRVLVVGVASERDAIDPALLERRRFLSEIIIDPPSFRQHSDLLHFLLGARHSLSHAEVEQLAVATQHFVGADLAHLFDEAASSRLLDLVTQSDYDHHSFSNSDPSLSEEDLSNFSKMGLSEGSFMPKYEDLEKAMMKMKPLSARDVVPLNVPRVKWEDIGGHREVKRQLRRVFEMRQNCSDSFRRRPTLGVLLYGPPGCSKTLMARAVATEAGMSFFSVKGPELYSKLVGESEKAVHNLFVRAKMNPPSVVFFDEFDSLVPRRSSDNLLVSKNVVNQLLFELDGLSGLDVVVMAATNRPEKVDPAILRAGRFHLIMYVGLPNEEDRKEIFEVHLRNVPRSSDVCSEVLASLTDGYSGADIACVCKHAALALIKDNHDIWEVKMQHFRSAIAQVKPLAVDFPLDSRAKFERYVSQS